MRISDNTKIDTMGISKTIINNPSIVDKVVKQGSETTGDQMYFNDSVEETRIKVQDVVDKMNEMLEVNHSTSKFVYHEGLERYYVTVVNRDTDEVVKEIPPRKLLDAFYEMQKMLGMIVDEKI